MGANGGVMLGEGHPTRRMGAAGAHGRVSALPRCFGRRGRRRHCNRVVGATHGERGSASGSDSLQCHNLWHEPDGTVLVMQEHVCIGEDATVGGIFGNELAAAPAEVMGARKTMTRVR